MKEKKIDLYDLFPDSGLVRQYKPFIIRETKKYTQKYWLTIKELLPYAVLIAHDAERKFNPRLGYDFSTFLRWHLRGLHRHCKKEYRNRGIYLSRDWEKKPSDRQRALVKYGGRINWNEHRPALINLEQRQGQSLRLVEKATLDWMIEPDGRTLPQVAAWIGCTKGYASKVRYKLLHKIHSHLQTV